MTILSFGSFLPANVRQHEQVKHLENEGSF